MKNLPTNSGFWVTLKNWLEHFFFNLFLIFFFKIAKLLNFIFSSSKKNEIDLNDEFSDLVKSNEYDELLIKNDFIFNDLNGLFLIDIKYE